jgi:hypothetical protein
MLTFCGFDIKEQDGVWIAFDKYGRWIIESENLRDVIDWLIKFGGNYEK